MKNRFVLGPKRQLNQRTPPFPVYLPQKMTEDSSQRTTFCRHYLSSKKFSLVPPSLLTQTCDIQTNLKTNSIAFSTKDKHLIAIYNCNNNKKIVSLARWEFLSLFFFVKTRSSIQINFFCWFFVSYSLQQICDWSPRYFPFS